MAERLNIIGPFVGVVDGPSPGEPPSAFDDVLNFLCRKKRIHTRPKLTTFGSPPDGSIIRLVTSFVDVLGKIHTLALTTKNAFFITAGPVWNPLTYPGGITNLDGTALPYGWVNMLHRVYFSNGSKKVLFADGESSIKLAGNVQGTARFLAEQASHLILGYTTEPELGSPGSMNFGRRVRWSASGNPDAWDPSITFSAGLKEFEEVPDRLAGLFSLGRNTFVGRSNGFSVMYPTGIGTTPFAFEHFSTAPEGVGIAYPYTLSVYGNIAAFVAQDDIYVHTGFQIFPIGDTQGRNTKKKIFKDLSLASGDHVWATIIPKLGPGVDYLSYWLTIPGVNVTWVYHFDEGNWVRFSSTQGRLTALGAVATS